MRIGIDIDDTISNTYEYFFPYAQNYTINDLGKSIGNIDKEAIKRKYITSFHNWNQEEEKKFFDKYYEKLLNNVKPKLYAKETIKKLRKDGNEIYIITARFLSDKFSVEELTKKWLKDNNIEYDNLIINAKDKVQFVKENNIEAFIDDSRSNCEKISEANVKTYIMDSIVNTNYKNEKITRIYSWPHFYSEIKKLEEENK